MFNSEYKAQVKTREQEMQEAVTRMEAAFEEYQNQVEDLERTCENYKRVAEKVEGKLGAFTVLLKRMINIIDDKDKTTEEKLRSLKILTQGILL